MSWLQRVAGLDWDRIGLFGLLLFAAAGFSWFEGAQAGVLIVAVAVLFCYGKALLPLLRKPIALFPLIFSLWVCVRALARYLEVSGDPDGLLSNWTRYYLVAGGLPALGVAVFLAADRSRILLMLGMSLLALLVALLAHCSPAQVLAYMTGERAFFGIGNAAGLYISTAILGILLFALWGEARGEVSTRRHIVQGVFAVLLTALTFALVWNQNRSVLLVMLVVFPVVLYRMCTVRQSGPLDRRFGAVLAVVLLSLTLALLSAGGSEIRQRFQDGIDTIEQAFAKPEAELPPTATGARIRLWRAGVAAVADAPLLGHGPGVVPQLLQGDPVIGHHKHVHNLYLQLLVDLGLVGLLLYLLVLAVLLRGLWGRRDEALPRSIYLFGGGAVAMFLLANLTQIRIDDGHAMYYVTLLYAVLFVASEPVRRVSSGSLSPG